MTDQDPKTYTARSATGEVPLTASQLAEGLEPGCLGDAEPVPVYDATGEIVGWLDDATGEYEAADAEYWTWGAPHADEPPAREVV